MKHKKTFTMAMTLMTSAALLAGCASTSKLFYFDDGTTENDVKILSFYGYKADDLDFSTIEKSLHGFMDEMPSIQIGYEGLKGQLYWDTIELRHSAGALDDVIMMDQEHVLSLWSTLADVKDYVDINLFNDLVKDQIKKSDDSIRFVPMTLASYCLYVNYDLLKAHGFSAPQNYAEFATICDYFTERGVTPIICNQRRSLCSLVQGKSLYDVYQQTNSGETIEQYNENPAMLAEKLEVGIDFIADMFKKGWIDRAATLNTLQTSNDKSKNGDLWLFAQGEQPFAVTGGWAPLRLRKALSDMKKTMNFGVHPYPIMEDGCVLVMDVNNCVSVNAASPNKEEAIAFLTYLTKPDAIWDYCDVQCCFSPLKNETRVPSDPSVAPTAEYYKNGRAVIGTNYQLNMPLDAYLMSVTADMCVGDDIDAAAAGAKLRLFQLLTGEGA